MTRRQCPEQTTTAPDVVLTPRSVTELFDAALAHYKSNFAVYLYTMVVAVFPAALVQKFAYEIWFKPMLIDQVSNLTVSKGAQFNNYVSNFAFVMLGSNNPVWPGILGLFLMFCGTAACVLLTSGEFALKPVTPKEALIQTARSSGWLLACATILIIAACGSLIVGYVVAMIIGGIIALIPFPASNAVGSISALVLGYIFACVPLAQHCYFAIQIVLIEGKTPWQVWDRNCILVRQRQLRSAVLSFASLPLIVLLTTVVVLGSASDLIEQLVIHPLAVHFSAAAGNALANIVVNLMVIILLPYVAIVTTFIYYDYRMRREALDIRVFAERTEVSEGAAQ